MPTLDLTATAPLNLPDRLRKHLPAATSAAESNSQSLNATQGKKIVGLMQELGRIASPGTPAANRVQRIRFVAGKWSDVVSQAGACRKGCSHCCHVPVLVPRAEARLISKRAGVPLAKNPPAALLSHELEAHVDGFIGQPCVFLREGSCSIYDHRPLACRTLVNMDDTELLCELVPDVAVPVPYANNTMIRGIFAVVTQDEPHADIREWFAPQGF